MRADPSISEGFGGMEPPGSTQVRAERLDVDYRFWTGVLSEITSLRPGFAVCPCGARP